MRVAVFLLGLGLLVSTGACDQERLVAGEGEDAGDGGGTPDGSTPAGTYEAFTTTTRGTTIDEFTDVSLVIAGTDAAQAAGCSLLANEEANPGQAAALVFAKFGLEGQNQCPAGSYAINGDPTYCSDLLWGQYLRENCAVYKRWDSSGALAARILATGGSAQVTETYLGSDQSRCTVQMQLLFPGGNTYSDSFSFDFSNFASPPFCVQNTCYPACAAWQTCNVSGQCENVACVNKDAPCPQSGTPACCNYGDPYREFSCNESQSTPGSWSCCVNLGDSCRYNDDCCWPYSCLSTGYGTLSCR